jgi:haloalkane dehalogenase
LIEKRYATVLGRRMAYVETGAGDPIVFLHGNPTSSFLWRKVIPPLSTVGRCIAPDLIGMGDSDKLAESGPGSYRLVEHRRYLDALLDVLGVADAVTLVVHDWGSALGFDWGHRHSDRIKGIAYMEAIVGPMSWDTWPEQARSIFRGFRSEAGEELVLRKNYFVERVLPASVLSPMSSQVLDEYRRPFLEPGESRRPTLSWPREIPFDGHPEDVHEIVTAYNSWLAASPIPKLFVNAEPGFLSREIAQATSGWTNQETVCVPGHHFVQEDSGERIGAAIAEWLHKI